MFSWSMQVFGDIIINNKQTRLNNDTQVDHSGSLLKIIKHLRECF